MRVYNESFTPEELQTETWLPVRDYELLYEVSNIGRVRRTISTATYIRGTLLTPFTVVGYYRVGLSKNGKAIQYSVHRLVMSSFVGECPAKHLVDHVDGCKTNNRLNNLEYVTFKENMCRASKLGLLPSGDDHYLRHSQKHKNEISRRMKAHPEWKLRGDKHPSKTKPECLSRGDSHYSRTNPEKLARGDDNGSRLRPESLKRGEKNHNSIFTAQQVLEIREYLETHTVAVTARKFNVGHKSISNIKHRKTWTHV